MYSFQCAQAIRTCLYPHMQLDFISSSCQKHFPLMCFFCSLNLLRCKVQCQGWIMDGQDIARRNGTLSAFWGIQRKVTLLCLDYRATPDATIHCCSIRWKSSEEMLWLTQRERFSTAPTSCNLCYSASCGAFALGLSLHVPDSFHFVWLLKN